MTLACARRRGAGSKTVCLPWKVCVRPKLPTIHTAYPILLPPPLGEFFLYLGPINFAELTVSLSERKKLQNGLHPFLCWGGIFPLRRL